MPRSGSTSLEVRHRRDDAGLQRLDRDDVLDPDAHRVAGEALGVGDDDARRRRRRTPGAARGSRPRRCRRARACRSRARRTPCCGAISCRRDTPRRSACATSFSITPPMWSTSSRVPWNALFAVTVPSTSQIGAMPRSRAASAALHDERRGAHADDHPVAALVERQRRLLDHLVGRGGARREEARADPVHQCRGGVVGGDDHDPPAAPGADPVLGERDRLGGARARRVDLRVRPARADELGELRVAHRQHAEQEAAVERRTARVSSCVLAARGCAGRAPRARSCRCSPCVEHPRAQRLELGQPPARIRPVVWRVSSSANSS